MSVLALARFAFVISLILSPSVFAAGAKFGPGVTGGGDSCKQQIARSYGLLTKLFKTDKINLSQFGVNQDHALSILRQVTFQYSTNLQKDGVPVEMLNVFSDNVIIVDEKVCGSLQEPLAHFTPLLLHEVIRLMGLDDGADYHISNQFQSVILLAVGQELGTARRFQILDGYYADGLSIAWGLDNEDVDFMALEKLSDDEKQKFLDQNSDHLVNYLVSVQNMQILATVRSTKTALAPEVILSNGAFSSGDKIKLISSFGSPVGFIEGKNDDGILLEKIFVYGGNQYPSALDTLFDNNCSDLMFDAFNKVLDADTKKYMEQFPSHTIRVTRGPSDSSSPYTAYIYLGQKIERYADFELLKVDFNIAFNAATKSLEIKSFHVRRESDSK